MPSDLWPAPTATAPVAGDVSVPGSKSIANRALILAALADGPSRINGLPLDARDIALMIGALRTLGCHIEIHHPGDTTNPAVPAAFVTPGPVIAPAAVDCGLAGTVMRFVPPVAGLADGAVSFDGDRRARERPMATMLSALRQAGVSVDDGGRGALPFTVLGRGRVAGGDVNIDASASSQFVTALLLSGARFDNGLRIRHRGRPLPSLPHIEMTCRMLLQNAVAVDADTADTAAATWSVAPGAVAASRRDIEPDLSNALPLAAAALVTSGSVLVRGWPRNSLQPADRVLEVVEMLGGRTVFTADGLIVSGGGRVRGINADLRDVGELVPTIAALCALADGPSRLSGIGHIAGHETDRLTALADEINNLGGDVTAMDDGLAIRPRPLHGGRWATYHDHRMATAGAIIGLAVPGVLIDNIATTAKTFAQFPTVWTGLVGAAAGAGG